jgi:hypothetical protein
MSTTPTPTPQQTPDDPFASVQQAIAAPAKTSDNTDDPFASVVQATQPSQQDQPGFWSRAYDASPLPGIVQSGENAVKNFGSAADQHTSDLHSMVDSLATGDLRGAANHAAHLLTGSETPFSDAAKSVVKLYVDDAKQQYQNVKTNGVVALPVIGTAASNYSKDVQAGNTAGAVGDVVGGAASVAPLLLGDEATAAKAGDVAGKAVRAVKETPAAEAVSNTASGLKNLATDIPAETESNLVKAIGDSAENNGFARSDVSTLKDAVSDLSDKFKGRAQSVYQALDSEAPGFQELRDKIGNLQKAYKAQLNLDPDKAADIGSSLSDAKDSMANLLDEGQTARWKQADQDWSRYKALQQVQGKANAAATDLTSDELQDVAKLKSGVQSLGNMKRAGNPIDMLSRAFGDDAGNIRQIVQKSANTASNVQAAQQFLKWAGLVGGAGVLGHGAASLLGGH